MGFTDDVRSALLSRIGRGKRYANNKRMADELGVDPSQLNRFLKKERGLNADSLGRILDGVGGSIAFEDDAKDASRDVCLHLPDEASGDSPLAALAPEDYIAVPLVAADTAIMQGRIPDDRIQGWMLVCRQQESLQFRSDLVAVTVEPDDRSMIPALHPGDIALIDRGDRDPTTTGRIMLVREPGPEGRVAIRRVSARQLDGEVELVFYSEDNRQFPPTLCRPEQDFDGDIAKTLGGTVVWAWNDMSGK